MYAITEEADGSKITRFLPEMYSDFAEAKLDYLKKVANYYATTQDRFSPKPEMCKLKLLSFVDVGVKVIHEASDDEFADVTRVLKEYQVTYNKRASAYHLNTYMIDDTRKNAKSLDEIAKCNVDDEKNKSDYSKCHTKWNTPR
jgi:hypothetical protein